MSDKVNRFEKLQRRNRLVGWVKWFFFLFFLGCLLLAWAKKRTQPTLPISSLSATNQPNPTLTATTPNLSVATSYPLAQSTPNQTPMPVIAPLIWNSSVTTYKSLQLRGSGQPDTTLRIQVGDLTPAMTSVSADGDWVAVIELPKPGMYSVTIEMLNLEGQRLDTYTRQLELLPEAIPSAPVPFGQDQEPLLETATPSVALNITEVATEPPPPTSEPVITPVVSEIAPAEPFTLDPPDDLANFIGGWLLLDGTGTPKAALEVVVQSERATERYPVVVDGGGRWQYTPWVRDTGVITVEVRSLGQDSADDQFQFTLAPSRFGSKGDCRNKIAPFGENRGSIYVVANCEYFSLIAIRLGFSVKEMKNANPQISNYDVISAGDLLNIPQR